MRRFVSILCALVVLVVAYDTTLESPTSINQSDPLYRQPRQSPIVASDAMIGLQRRAQDGWTRAWVYFVDKGFTDQTGFKSAVFTRHVRLTSRATKRRAKIQREHVEYCDIPVEPDYLDQVVARGARLRHTSRWLNAASFDVRLSDLAAIATLQCVRKITPVVPYRGDTERDPVTPSGSSPRPDVTARAATLDYGLSYTQLALINVPPLHDLGFMGQGVLVCMMDTGFRKDHIAFQIAYAEGRVLAEHDFVFNDGDTQDEPEDNPGQHGHGTMTWSELGGEVPGQLYGPAYKADFILAKTEDTRSETPIEEDNWVAGIEWADSIGASVVSSSLAYSDWYSYGDFNGDIAVTTIAADIAASLNILVCNAMGNEGPDPGTLDAPADADSILSCGAVGSDGVISMWSSRGPTSDGRFKPEVCAMSPNVVCANAIDADSIDAHGSGTSSATPQIGGCAAVLMSAHPDWTAMQVRDALMLTASQASTPDNDYGWGIANLLAAYNYVPGAIPATVDNFSLWDVGDGQSIEARWDTLAAANITGYRLYYGTAPQNYTDTLFVPGRTVGSAQITGLTEGTEYFVAVVAVNAAGTESLSRLERSQTPLSIPRPVDSFFVDPDYQVVRVSWYPSQELDFDHYIVYRGEDSTSLLPYNSTLTTSGLDDGGTVAHTRYYYQVQAVDAEGNAGPLTSIQSAIPATFDLGVLVVNQTSDFAFSANPSVAQQTAVYTEMFADLPHAYMRTVNGAPDFDKSILGEYNTVYILDDDNVLEQWHPSLTPKLDWFLSNGNNLVVIGWFTPNEILYSSIYGGMLEWFQVDNRTQIMDIDCSGGLGAEGFPDIRFDSTRVTELHPSYYGRMRQIVSLEAVDTGSEIIYGYDSHTNDPSREGLPVGARCIVGNSKVAFIGLPLYYMQTADAQALIAALDAWINPPPPAPGDLNADGTIDALDLMAVIDAIFYGVEPPAGSTYVDTNGDCIHNVLDVVCLIDYIFRGGADPLIGCAS